LTDIYAFGQYKGAGIIFLYLPAQNNTMQANTTVLTQNFPASVNFQEQADLWQMAQRMGYTTDEFMNVVNTILTDRNKVEDFIHFTSGADRIY
jgi:hypothetical protein